ncbi:protein COFACTOR ASSEMBLY OF COMPLEX C SUBUNIT B CCB2, chloroplastic isoform X2 [Vigna unguiculata]|uniref:protein COFACTOR ASSEMBLY OF COMPLEX C SUBUNIT B CCB2, chloroplastic isoform X2 n=1 Tax=Vigna unguiculata TaxID=3917 RepID=UPI001016880C|nr:protein COFACTOR ASSEMBLY OF COMPLEX C SUBUNIT B CCB2, chloroplastic isoform X2 [Vigna unguiculata]
MNNIATICFKPCIPFPVQCPKTCFRKFPLTTIPRSSLQDSQPPNSTQQQLNLSVLRFTLGIPGLDESYLPRWIGYGFGSLLLLNHFLGSDAAAITPAQLSTEVLGLSLASFSIVLPYLGKFLKGAQPVDEKAIPEGTEQIFVMSTEVGNGLKEDLAWASYVLLRNTNAIAMLILIQGEICARGYWNIPDDTSKEILPDWFKKKIGKAGLYDLKDTLYFPQDADSEFQDLVPMGTRCLLIQPVFHGSDENDAGLQKPDGFILLASTTRYAFSNKDKAWIAAVANKFRGRVV